MKKRKSRQQAKAGLPPGSLVFTGSQRLDKVLIHHLRYNENIIEERSLDSHASLVFNVSIPKELDWYDFRGLHDPALIRKVGDYFKVHNLVLEDVMDTFQRPKFEEHEGGLFFIFKAFSLDKENMSLVSEQVAIYYREGLLLSFQESETDLFSSVRRRILSSSGRIRSRGTDYLCYALIDEVVDDYYVFMEKMELEVQMLEQEVIKDAQSVQKNKIYKFKKELLGVKKGVYPLREAVSKYRRSENGLILKETHLFIQDLYDHVIQSMEMLENLNSLILGIHDMYNSEISFKMNQVMQVLTITASLFIPITFLAGIYGMNFKYIPELNWEYGYLYFWGLVIIIVAILLIYFKRNKWI